MLLRTVFIFPRQCTYIVFILQCLIVLKTTAKLSKKSRNRHRVKRFRRRRLYCKFIGVARHESGTRKKLYLGQNLKQYVMKEAVIYKILRYRQNRCHTNEERWTDHSWHKAKIQHPQQCQSVFTVESQDNIPDCTKTHIIKTALPISLPGVKKLLHTINTHRFCAPITIKLFGFPIVWFWVNW
jgi:hypothetical protein